MAKGYTAEYVQWLEENNFSPEDEDLILKTTTKRMVIWLILSCIPTINFFAMPLLMNAWSWRKIIKQKSFEPRPGMLYSLFALAMYITFILIIPWILWIIVKKGSWGCGIRGLIRKGKIGNGHAVSTDGTDRTIHAEASPRKKSFPWAIMILVVLVLLVVFAVIYLTQPQEPTPNTSVSLPNYQGLHLDAVISDLDTYGIAYNITYVTDSDQKPGTVINQNPVAGSVLDMVVSVDLIVVSDMVQVPDFSTAATVEEITTLAQQHGLTVKMVYADEAAGLTFDSIPEGMVIEQIYADHSVGTMVAPGTQVNVTICLKPQYDLTGNWYHADYSNGSLNLTQYTFREDGTFSYYDMGYMPVDYETDLYTYGTYWDGAMGADCYDGTYDLNRDRLILHYEYWNWDTNATESTSVFYQLSIAGGMLNFYNEASGLTRQYLPGTQPDRDAQLPFVISASWYAFGTPENYDHGNELDVYVFYLFEDGTLESNHYHYMKSSDDWYFPGAGSTLIGNYTFDGSSLFLHYTGEVQSIYDNYGEYVGSQTVPMDETHTITLTVLNGIVTEVSCATLSLTLFSQYDPSPYVNVDIMGTPLYQANQLFP